MDAAGGCAQQVPGASQLLPSSHLHHPRQYSRGTVARLAAGPAVTHFYAAFDVVMSQRAPGGQMWVLPTAPALWLLFFSSCFLKMCLVKQGISFSVLTASGVTGGCNRNKQHSFVYSWQAPTSPRGCSPRIGDKVWPLWPLAADGRFHSSGLQCLRFFLRPLTFSRTLLLDEVERQSFLCPVSDRALKVRVPHWVKILRSKSKPRSPLLHGAFLI